MEANFRSDDFGNQNRRLEERLYLVHSRHKYSKWLPWSSKTERNGTMNSSNRTVKSEFMIEVEKRAKIEMVCS